jgi:predicted ATPase with chaperone activity
MHQSSIDRRLECLVPGEVSLAHGGVLFLDEGPEFRRSVLEAIGAALRDGQVTHGLAGSLPARPQLLLVAANPCPCGFWQSPTRECRCSDVQRAGYLQRLKPLLRWGLVPVMVRMTAEWARGPSPLVLSTLCYDSSNGAMLVLPEVG